MKIGIFVYSKTGNTASVAERLKEKLLKDGHDVVWERLETEGEEIQGLKNFRFKRLPDTAGYDLILLGSPVEAFSLCPVMKSFLRQMSSIRGKRVGLIVTEHFRRSWLGGNNAVRFLTRSCVLKGAVVAGSMIVNWSSRHRENQISEGIERLGGLAI